MRKKIEITFACLLSIIVIVFLYSKTKDRREYRITAKKFDIQIFENGDQLKWQSNKMELQGKVFSFSKSSAKAFKDNANVLEWYYTIETGRTVHKGDTLDTWLVGWLKDEKNAQERENVSITSVGSRSCVISVISYGNGIQYYNYYVPSNEIEKFQEYQLLFPETLNKRYTDSVLTRDIMVDSMNKTK